MPTGARAIPTERSKAQGLLTEQGGSLGGTQAELGLKELGTECGHASNECGFGGPRQAEQDERGVSEEEPDGAG